MHPLLKKLKARLSLNSTGLTKVAIVLLCAFIALALLDKLAIIALSGELYIAIAATALLGTLLVYFLLGKVSLPVIDSDTRSDIPLLLLNSQGVILGCNAHAQAIFNHEDINNQPLDELLVIQQFSANGIKRLDFNTLKLASNNSRARLNNTDYKPVLVTLGQGSFVMALMSIERETRLASELEAEKELLEVTLSSIGDGVICTDIEGRITYINPVSEAILAQLNKEVVGKPFDEVMAMYNEESEALVTGLPRLCLEKGHTICLPELTSITNHLGLTFAIQDSFSPIFAKDGSFLGTVMVFQDVTESRILAKKMSHLAHHDQLTGLPNRLLLQDRLVQACKRGKRGGHQFALVFLDINKFKKINDTFGHDYGDLLLKEVAKRLTEKLRACDTVARMGGDEFVLLIDSIKDKRHVRKVVSKVLERVNSHYSLQQVSLKATMSAGIALYPDDGQDIDELLKHADTAMYRAKQTQQLAAQFYNAELDQDSELCTQQEQAMRVAIEQGEFIPYFQPILDAYNRKIVKLEVLARWQQSEQLNSASSFIAMAEHADLINRIGSQVRAKSLECAKEWLQQHDNLVVTFNLSLAELLDSQCQSEFFDLLRQHQIAPSQVEIEIQERDLMALLNKSPNQLKRWQATGVNIAIDHFGLAAASMDYLNRLVVDTIKIPPLFLSQQQDSDNDQDQLIASMATSLSVECVAVGVESELQAKSLCFKGCHMLQGEYLFAPKSAAELEQLLETTTVVAKRKQIN